MAIIYTVYTHMHKNRKRNLLCEIEFWEIGGRVLLRMAGKNGLWVSLVTDMDSVTSQVSRHVVIHLDFLILPIYLQYNKAYIKNTK